jgi:hypothetical protein
MPAHLLSLLLLLVLTRDGVLHRLQDGKETTEAAPRATAIAVFGDRHVAVLAGDRLTVDGRAVPGHFRDLRALAGGARLWALSDGAAAAVDPRSGKRDPVHAQARAHLLTVAGESAFVECDGVATEWPAARAWALPGRPLRLAAGDHQLWGISSDGTLWELNRRDRSRRDLGLGDWRGTLALAAVDGQLYAVTVSGKLWHIDPVARTKTIVAMDGWQGAIDLAVLR